MAESASSVRAGKAFVEISAKDGLLVRGLKGAEKKLKAWGESIQGIGQKVAAAGLIATGGFIASLKMFANEGDALAKMSQRTGLAVETLSALGYAAEQSGSDLDSLEKGIKHVQKEGGDASLGGLMAIADELAAIEDPGERAARAMQIFGKSGTDLLPLMDKGGAGMRELMTRAEELGVVMGNDAAQAAVVMGDNLGDVFKQAKAAAISIGAQLAPVVNDLAVRVQRYMKQAIDWIKANQQTIVLAAKVAVAVTAVGGALIAIGIALKTAAIAAGALVAAFTFIVTPIGMAVTAFAAIVAAIESVSSAFGSIGGIAVEAIKGIVAALANGDIEAATTVLTTSLTLIWERWSVGLQIIFEELKDRILVVLGEIKMVALEAAEMLGIISPAERNRGINNTQGAAKQRRKELDDRMTALQAAAEITLNKARTDRDAAVSRAMAPGATGITGPSSVDQARTDMYDSMKAAAFRGTFNKYNMRGLAGGSQSQVVEKKIEKNTNDAAKNLVEAVKLLGDIKLRLPVWG